MKKETATPEDKSIVDIETKKLLDQQERQELLFGADAFLPQPSFDKQLEQYELRNGQFVTLKQIDDLIIASASEYEPMFRKDTGFFAWMYKLRGWHHLDPTAYIKPACVATDIKQYIYARFDAEVLPTLLAKDNPFIAGYIKRYKLFQFLNDNGKLMLEGFIRDAVNVMKECSTWHEFELKYAGQYKLNVQLKLMPVQ